MRVALRTGVLCFVFQSNGEKREASAKCESCTREEAQKKKINKNNACTHAIVIGRALSLARN